MFNRHKFTDARARYWALFFGAVFAGLLLGSGVQAAENSVVPAPATAPTDLASALAFIAEANAKADAETLEALQKDLTPLEKEWGIKLHGIRLTAAGYALDLRFQVLDPVKAVPILQRKFSRNPHLMVEKSGATLGVPRSEKVGAMRTSVRTAGQIKKLKRYFIIFANPGRHVKSGDKVTIVIGKFKAENVSVL